MFVFSLMAIAFVVGKLLMSMPVNCRHVILNGYSVCALDKPVFFLFACGGQSSEVLLCDPFEPFHVVSDAAVCPQKSIEVHLDSFSPLLARNAKTHFDIVY